MSEIEKVLATQSGFTPDQAIGLTVRQYLFAFSLEQRDLVQVLGITGASISRKIKGLVGWSATEILLTARFLGLDVADLMPTWQERTPESEDGFEGWVPAAFKPGVGAAYRIRTDDLSQTRA